MHWAENCSTLGGDSAVGEPALPQGHRVAGVGEQDGWVWEQLQLFDLCPLLPAWERAMAKSHGRAFQLPPLAQQDHSTPFRPSGDFQTGEHQFKGEQIS